MAVALGGLALASGNTACAQDGSLVWSFTLRGFASSSPALSPDGTTVYIGVDTRTAGRVAAVNTDGSTKWVIDRPDWVSSSPAVAPDGTVYVGCYDGALYALNPQNGKIKWQYDTRTFVLSSPAVGADGTVYFGAGDGRLYAVDQNGVERWNFPAADWIESSPAIGADGTIYVGSRDQNIYAVRPDGSEKWRFRTGGPVGSSPALGADGTVYVGSTDKHLYAIAPDGSKRWDFLANGEIQASPVLGPDGTVYFAAWDASFYAVEAETGALRWRVALNTNSVSSAAVRGDGTVIFGADDGIVRALDAADGRERWRFDTKAATGDLIESSPLVAPDGSIYFGSLNGLLYKLRGSGSPLSALSSWPSFRGNIHHTGRAAYVANGGRLINLASRGQVAGGETLIAGFVVQGTASRNYLVRGSGPALAQFGVEGFMPDPRLDVYVGPSRVWENDNWSEGNAGPSPVDVAAEVGAFPLPLESRDAAMVLSLAPGLYTTHLTAADGRGGVALFEAYEAAGGDRGTRLVNLSLRGKVGAGENILILGFAVGGTNSIRLLVRAVGPGLAGFGVPDVLTRPKVDVYREQELLRTNTGWTSGGLAYDLVAAAQSVGAFPLAASSADSALALVVPPGVYTIQIAGVGGLVGEVLAEIYVLR